MRARGPSGDTADVQVVAEQRQGPVAASGRPLRLFWHPATLVLLSAVLAGVSNVLWRFGEGAAIMLAATRACAGLVLFSPLLVAAVRSGALRRAASDRGAWPAILLSGATIWTAALLFREVPGPLAAAAIGVSPVVALVVGRVVGSRHIPRRAKVAIVVCTVAAFVAAGPQTVVASQLLFAALFLSTDVACVLATEHARRRHDASTITVSSLVVGAIPAPLLWLHTPAAMSGITVGIAVAVVGTLARLLRAQALGSISAAVVASSTQVTALLTAVGGAVIFADTLGPGRFAALLVACAASFAAIVWSAQDSRPTVSEPLAK